MIYVIKFNGKRQPLKKEKIVKTCLRMRASPKIAEKIADKIRNRAYDGITTKKILKMIYSYLEEYRPEIKHQIDLREAISLLRPKPDFEHYIGQILKEYGYKIEMNRILDGKCVDHEIDIIATKGVEKLLVEVKHHREFHTFTGVGEFLEAAARLEDLLDGYRIGKNPINFTSAMVVINTKISDHARRYSTCKGIEHLCWKSPPNRGLEQLISEKGLYPITFLKYLDFNSQVKLGDAGIVLLKQLIEINPKVLWRKTKISKKKLQNFINKAKEIIGNQTTS